MKSGYGAECDGCRVLLLTASFPFGVGEQFLESELPYWRDVNLTVIPASTGGPRRDVAGANFKVDERCAILDSKWAGLSAGIWRAMFSREFITELHRRPSVLFRYRRLKSLFVELLLAQRLARLLLKHYGRLLTSGTQVILYSYWFSWTAHAAAMLKRQLPSVQVISRAHRVDLYEYARPGNYMPFAKSFHSDMDAVYPVSEDGRRYLLEQYRIPEAKVRVARLGVRDPGTIARDGARTGTFRVLSISYAKPVKRLHRIIGGLVALRARYPDIDVLWTHIGDGPELVKLKSLAAQYGVEADFLGQLNNRQVLDYLAEAEIDAFINVSASEGVPVSIMEALSFGVPVLATDVGGTREIVEDRVGRLLPADFSDDEFVEALIAVKDIKDRTLIRAHFYEVCAAESVFPRFVEEVLGSGAHETSPLRREI